MKLNSFGCSRLDNACLQNNAKIVERILESRADPNFGNCLGGGNAHTCCLYESNPDIIDLLVKYRCDLNMKYPLHGLGEGVNTFAKQQVREGSASLVYATFATWPAPPVFTAIILNRPEHLQRLLKNRADPKAARHDGVDAIEFAKQSPHRDKLLAILEGRDDSWSHELKADLASSQYNCFLSSGNFGLS